MPWKSQWTADIPSIDAVTYLFGAQQTGEIGDRPLFIDADSPERHHLSLTAYRDWAKRFAAGLVACGFKPGDRLLLFSGNNLFFPVVMMGTMMAEGVFSGANPTYVSRELAYQLKDSGASFLISAAASLDISLSAVDSIGFPRSRVLVFDSGRETLDGTTVPINGIRPWTDLIGTSAEGEVYRWPAFTAASDLQRLVCLNYSSGTTGVPKGVMISHRNYVANSEQTTYQAKADPNYESWRSTASMLCFLPMYHAYGQTYYAYTAPKRGVPTYIMPRFDFIRYLEHIQRFKITDLIVAPPVAVALAKRAEVKNYDLSSVVNISSGAAPLGNEQSRELESVWPSGQVNIKQAYGMTEMTCNIAGYHPLMTATTNSVGELVPNCEARIMADDERTELMDDNQRGELWVLGPSIMLGYWQKPDATRGTLTSDGWLKTGDIAYRDEQNMIYIVDRKKELIKVKGNQVAPAELETLLMAMDGVADAAVIGVTIEHEEYPRAFLVLKPGADAEVTETQVHEYMRSRVAPHKRLTGGVAFVQEIPKNPSGKILRKILREQVARDPGAHLATPLRSKL